MDGGLERPGHRCAESGCPPRSQISGARACRGKVVSAADKNCSHIKGWQRGATLPLSPLPPRRCCCRARGAKALPGTGCRHTVSRGDGWPRGEQPGWVLHQPRAAARSREEENSLFLVWGWCWCFFFLHLASFATAGPPHPGSPSLSAAVGAEELKRCGGANRRARPAHRRVGVRPETEHTSHLFLTPPALELSGLLLGQDWFPPGSAAAVREVPWWGAGCPHQFTHTHTPSTPQKLVGTSGGPPGRSDSQLKCLNLGAGGDREGDHGVAEPGGTGSCGHKGTSRRHRCPEDAG